MCYADIGSYDSAVADLRVVVLIQQRANDIVYKLVFAIGHIQGKGSDKSEECELFLREKLAGVKFQIDLWNTPWSFNFDVYLR